MRGTAGAVAQFAAVEARPHGLGRRFAPGDRTAPVAWRGPETLKVTTRQDERRRSRQPFADPPLALLLIMDAVEHPFDKCHGGIAKAAANRDSVVRRYFLAGVLILLSPPGPTIGAEGDSAV